jgi:hypothetical protein
MGLLSDHKPYTAVTANIERLTSAEYTEDDVVEIIELVEIINIRPTGPTEAARALRKKLKYGNTHNQLRALTILDALIQNGGPQLSPLYKDANLLERLRLTATEESDQKVHKKIKALIHGWHRDLEGLQGYEELVKLDNQLPQKKRRSRPQPKYLSNDYHESDEEGSHSQRKGNDQQENDDEDPFATSSSRRVHSRHASASSPYNRSRSNSLNDNGGSVPSSRKSKNKSRTSNSQADGGGTARMSKSEVAKERPKIQHALAEAGTASTNLTNALKLINRDFELSIENDAATKYFKQCKALRRQILKYIHSIESEDYLGSLIHANDELVEALRFYDAMSHPDSDSDDEDWKVNRRMRKLTVSDDESDYSGAEDGDEERGAEPQRIAEPPKSPKVRRPPPPISPKPAYLRSKVQEDEDDPFGDSHVDESVPQLLKPKW